MTGTITRAVGRRLALGALALAPLALATRASAQSPTPENTVITNTATATWTDANSNTYTPVTASATVTVGFAAGVDASAAASVTPASPSTGNVLSYTVTNTGNGTDQFTVGATPGAGTSITGYRYAGTTYGTAAELNAVLGAVSVAAGANVTVAVIYDVDVGQGGATSSIALTATSTRSSLTKDTQPVSVLPPATSSVSVTPDASSVDRLPSNGTQYSGVFTVTNSGNTSGSFTLASSASPAGTTLSLVTTNGAAGTNGGTITLAAGASQSVTVVYTVANGAAAGTTADLRLTATSSTTPATTDVGSYAVRVVRAAVTMTKLAYRDNQTSAVGASTVLPGEYLQYKITVTNGGTANATTVAVSDPLPSQVTYDTATGDATGWTLTQSSGTVSASLAGGLAPGASRFFWIRVQVK
jgi:uncharacterized repeat protein (TIGR01451 family)